MKHAERANLARERTLRIEAEKQVKELKALVARYEQEAKATQEALAKSIQQVWGISDRGDHRGCLISAYGKLSFYVNHSCLSLFTSKLDISSSANH